MRDSSSRTPLPSSSFVPTAPTEPSRLPQLRSRPLRPAIPAHCRPSINAVAGTAPPGPCPAGVSVSRPRQVELLKPPPRSDNLILVRTVTATEASRSFAALLDEVEQGQTVIVTRGGRRIATIGPTTNGNGADVRALLQSSQLDEGFAADVSAARESVDSETPAWPGD